jgi:RNA polymerase sigma factor (sigma-70 family)
MNDADTPHPESPGTARRGAGGRLPFEVLIERHGPALLRFCTARLGPDRGEDAFQETLLAALRHYDELRAPGAAVGWLFSIAQRKIVDAARTRANQPVASDELEEHTATWHDPEPDSGIWVQVARLPPKQREAVGLRYLADLSHDDIAQVAGTSVEAARRNVFEGLRRLRKDLADDRLDL